MENNIPGSLNGAVRDKKNHRFFRKAGTSSATTTPVSGHPRTQPQRSFDSCSPLYGSPLQVIGQQNIDPALLASLASGLNRHHLKQQQQQSHAQVHAASIAGTTVNSPVFSATQSPVIFNEHDSTKANGRRFMTAPRRARSAERFDGMRVAYSASGDLSALSRPTPAGTPPVAPPITGTSVGTVAGEDPSLYRNYRSPQVLRTGMVENGGTNVGASSSPAPSLPLQPQLRQSVVASPVPSVASTTNTGPIPSPPPPYSKAIHEQTHVSPPSYKQAVAMGKGPIGKNGKILVNGNNRYNLPHTRGTQSLDTGNYIGTAGSAMGAGASLINGNNVTTPGSNGLRTVSSHPVFMSESSNEQICNCHKCQALNRHDPSCNELNDAVYMESQAFLMHEIMNDGMAFCSIM